MGGRPPPAPNSVPRLTTLRRPMPRTAPSPSTRPSPRLSRAARRDQLLASAAAVLVERGVAALTMEGVAAEAGVSKALPYSHFENAQQLLHALRDRELDRFGASIVGAVRDADGYEARIAAAVHSYFSFIAHRGSVLVAVLRTLPMDADEQQKRQNPAFFARLFQKELGLSEPIAGVASAIFVVGVSGAVDAWVNGLANRATIEAITVQSVIGGAAAVAAAERAGEIPVPSERTRS